MDHDRREHPRVKLRVPVELFVEGTDTPIRGATSDLSLGGCYIESMFPFPVGTNLEMKLQVDGTLLSFGAGGDQRSPSRQRSEIYSHAARRYRGTPSFHRGWEKMM